MFSALELWPDASASKSIRGEFVVVSHEIESLFRQTDNVVTTGQRPAAHISCESHPVTNNEVKQ